MLNSTFSTLLLYSTLIGSPPVLVLTPTMDESFSAHRKWAQTYAVEKAAFIKKEILSTPRASIDEYAVLNAFSWIKYADEYLETVKESAECTVVAPGAKTGPASSYLEDVSKDANFFNPSSLDMMASCYHVDDDYVCNSKLFKDIMQKHSWKMEDVLDKRKLNKSNERLKKGIALTRNEKYSDAITQLSDAIDIYPTADAFVARGAAYANIGAYILAVDDFRDALKLDSTHANASLYLYTTLDKISNMNVPATALSRSKTEVKEVAPKQCDTVDSGLVEIAFDESISRLKNILSSSDDSDSDSNDSSDGSVHRKKGRKRKRKRSEKKRSKDRDSKKRKSKKKRHKKEKKSKKHKRSSKGGTPIMSSSDDSDSKTEGVHPILQRQSHKLWG